MGEHRFSALRERWEQRAGERGDSEAAVLYARLPASLNAAIHRFHLRTLDKLLVPRLAAGARVLDAGCGYGRLSEHLAGSRVDLCLYGADFSVRFCQLYRQRTERAALCADIGALPFSPGSFDGLLVVTALMYFPERERREGMQSLLRCLRPGGWMLLVEPSAEVLAVMKLLRPSASRCTTGGEGFTEKELLALVREAGGEVIKTIGMPWVTTALPLLLLLNRLPRVQAALLHGAEWLDVRRPEREYGWWSLQRGFLIRVPVGE